MNPTPDSHEWRPKHSPWLVGTSVLLATFMQVLDTSVANVSLPHIAGNLSATTDEATWVLTSYLVSSAVILAAAGWLSGYFGRKRYLAFSVFLFTVSSALCGMAHSLPQLIFARILQGIGGGGLQPLSQAVLLESFPREERGTAMAAYGMGIVVAPIIGPILGGWITDNYSWRWIFYINVPIGIAGLVMQQMFLEDPPYLTSTRTKRIDYGGLMLMVAGIGLLQLVLDKGQEADWFEAAWIRWSTLAIAVILPAFVVWELKRRDPFVNLKLLADRNFGTGSCLAWIHGAVMFGSTALLPIFMQRLLRYTAFQSGLSMMPRGIGAFFSMLIVGRLIKRVENHLLLAAGLVCTALTCWLFSRINLDISQANIAWPLLLNGLGMSLIFVPLTTLTMSTLHRHDLNQASAIFSLMRNIGASVGISILFTAQARSAQTHHVALVSHLSSYSQGFLQWIKSAETLFSAYSPWQAASAAKGLAYAAVLRQASLLAFVDVFSWLAVICLISCPLVLLFRKSADMHVGHRSHATAD